MLRSHFMSSTMADEGQEIYACGALRLAAPGELNYRGRGFRFEWRYRQRPTVAWAGSEPVITPPDSPGLNIGLPPPAPPIPLLHYYACSSTFYRLACCMSSPESYHAVTFRHQASSPIHAFVMTPTRATSPKRRHSDATAHVVATMLRHRVHGRAVIFRDIDWSPHTRRRHECPRPPCRYTRRLPRHARATMPVVVILEFCYRLSPPSADATIGRGRQQGNAPLGMKTVGARLPSGWEWPHEHQPARHCRRSGLL